MKERCTLRRTALLISLLMTAGIATACGSDSDDAADAAATPTSTQLENVRVMLPNAPNGLVAGIIAGLENGTYEKQGLDVNILVPSNTASPVQSLAANSADLAFESSLDIIVGAAQDLPVKQIGIVIQQSGSGILTGKDSGIDLNNPTTLEGKTIGITGQAGNRAFLEDALTRNGVDVSKINIVNVGFNGIQALASKKIAAHGDTVIFRPPAYNQAIGKPLGDITTYQFRSYSDMGAPTSPLTALAATNEYLEKNGEVATRFLAGLQESLQWASDNPEEAAKLEVQHFPELKLAQTTAEWRLVSGLIRNEDTDKYGLTWQNPDKFDEVAAFLAAKKVAAKEVTAEQVMTNEFIPKR